MITLILRLTLLALLPLSLQAQSLDDEIRTLASEVDSLEYSIEDFASEGDYISLRFDCFVRRSHISGLVFGESVVRILMSSGVEIQIIPKSNLVSPVIVHEALKWILMSGQHKYLAATPEQQTKARALVKRAVEEKDGSIYGSLGSAQSLWSGINSWQSIASNCKFRVIAIAANKPE